MNWNKAARFLRDHDWLPALFLLALGCALRLAALGAVPYGLNQDEASAGYETWALLTSGVDRCGKSWPVLFISWGSGQNVLMSYLALPFVALLGLSELSIRLPNALCGCLTLLVFWRFSRRARGRAFGLLALFLLAVNPWHVMMSRWALESNLLPFFLLLGIWLTSFAREKPWALAGAAAAFGLSLYAYGTAFFFLPVYLVGAVIWLRRDLKPAPFCVSLAIFLVLALPIALCQLENALGWEEISVLGITLPRLTEGRQSATSVFGGGGLAAAWQNFRSFLSILAGGGDGLPYNALPFWRGGIFYFFGLPTAMLGIAGSVMARRDRGREGPMRLALLAGLVCAFLIQGNINRLNMLWLPLVWFSALGCWYILEKLGRWAVVPVAGIVLCAAVFVTSYRAEFAGRGNVNYFPGLGEAIEYADTRGAERIYITDYVNAPYAFALFYTRPAPEDFAATVEYTDETAAFRAVERFTGFEFQSAEGCDILILHESETGDRPVLYRAGRFAVCEGTA